MRDSHPLAGKTIKILFHELGKDPEELDFRLEDYWENVYGMSWMNSLGNPAALLYSIRFGFCSLPLDDEVVYGKIGALGYLIHVSEIVEQ